MVEVVSRPLRNGEGNGEVARGAERVTEGLANLATPPPPPLSMPGRTSYAR